MLREIYGNKWKFIEISRNIQPSAVKYVEMIGEEID